MWAFKPPPLWGAWLVSNIGTPASKGPEDLSVFGAFLGVPGLSNLASQGCQMQPIFQTYTRLPKVATCNPSFKVTSISQSLLVGSHLQAFFKASFSEACHKVSLLGHSLGFRACDTKLWFSLSSIPYKALLCSSFPNPNGHIAAFPTSCGFLSLFWACNQFPFRPSFQAKAREASKLVDWPCLCFQILTSAFMCGYMYRYV